MQDVLNIEGMKIKYVDDMAASNQSKDLKDGNVILSKGLEL